MSWNLPPGCTPEDVDASFGPEPSEDENPGYDAICWIAHAVRRTGRKTATRKDVLYWTFCSSAYAVSELKDWINYDEQAAELYEIYCETKDLTVLDLCLDRVAEAVTEEI